MLTFAEFVEFVKALMPAIVAAIAISGAVRTYRSQKRADRQERMHSEKRESYRLFIKSLNLFALEAVKNRVLDEKNQNWDKEIVSAVYGDLALVTLYSNTKVAELSVRAMENIRTGTQDNETTTVALSRCMKDDLEN